MSLVLSHALLRTWFKILLVLIVPVLLSACGGGGGGGDDKADKTPTISNGVFLDAAVQGVAYSSGSVSGMTGSSGEYQYESGQAVIFKIGDLVIGQVSEGKGILTPMDFGSGYIGLNVASFLQSIDQDGDPSNGIVITEEMHTALTGGGASINFDQRPGLFANDPAVQNVLNTLMPFTNTGSITLRTEEETLQHLMSELKINILEADVAGNYETEWATTPQLSLDFLLNADKSGTVKESADNVGTTAEDLTWQVDMENRLELMVAGATGLPMRFTLIQGTLGGGVLVAEVDDGNTGVYGNFTLVNIKAKSVSGDQYVTHCGVQFDPETSADVALHSMQFPVDQSWPQVPYNNSDSVAEYNVFTVDTFNGVPAVREDTYETATDTLIETYWFALGVDGAIYDIHAVVDGEAFPCSGPRKRFPANIAVGETWPVEIEDFTGQGEVLSTSTESPAGYTNTIQIRMTFDIDGTPFIYDQFFRVGEGTLDSTDYDTSYRKRSDIAPENPPANNTPPDYGTLTLSDATNTAENGVFDMVAGTHPDPYSFSWSSEMGAGAITLVVLTQLGTVSLESPSGGGYGCQCVPVIDNENQTVTFNNVVVTDTFPFADEPDTNYITINGVLDFPPPQ